MILGSINPCTMMSIGPAGMTSGGWVIKSRSKGVQVLLAIVPSIEASAWNFMAMLNANANCGFVKGLFPTCTCGTSCNSRSVTLSSPESDEKDAEIGNTS